MSIRSHFWFRVLAIAAIMLAQFGPRLLSSATSATGAPPAGTAGQVVAASLP
jgi:hypothetical protein